jgi:chemotaxis protein methyltransferase WspC
MRPGELARIEALLTQRIGLDPAAVGPNLIPRAVRLRMSELGIGRVGDYESLVKNSETELQALIEEAVIPESWFFRDELPFRGLQDHVKKTWAADPARAPLRVLSIPCAAGEEPYSIVIALVEAGLALPRFRVDAVDISTRRLELARCGIYSKNAFRGGGQGLRARYFRHHARGYELDPAIRARVRFLQGSILDAGLLRGEPRYDVLFCRNLLIYLDGPSRTRAMANLDRLLAADGQLVIGHADRLDLCQMEPRFTPVGEPGAFTYRREAAPSPGQNAAVSAFAPPDRIPPREAPRPAPAHGQGMPAGQEPPSQLQAGSGRMASAKSMEEAGRLADLGRHDEAIALCERSLRLQGPTAAAYYLMGVIHQAAGNRPRSEECFHKAVYLDPGHDDALLALALAAERRGESAAAAGFRRRAERAMLRKGAR